MEEKVKNLLADEKFLIKVCDQLFHSSLVGILLLDPERRILAANKAISEILGYSPEELIGKKTIEALEDEEQRAQANAIKKKVDEGYDRFETVFKRKDGRLVNLEISVTRVEIEGKEYRLYFFHDISDRKQLEAERHRQEELYRQAIIQADAVPYIRDYKTGEFKFLGENIVNFTGYTADEFKDFTLWHKIVQEEIMRGELEGLDIKEAVKLARSGKVLKWRAEYRIKTKSGEDRWIADSAIQLLGDNHKPIGSLGILQDITDRKRIEKNLENALAQLQKIFEETIDALMFTVESKDPYTAGHQRKVAKLATAIAQELGFPKDRIDCLRITSLVHDVGKLLCPGDILNKPGVLNIYEKNFLKLHPEYGYEILKKIEFPYPVADIVLQHHERINGSGYPKGLKDDEILLEARIIAVADVVEAMTSHRPYRPAYSLDDALAEIENNKGILYDENIVDICLYLFRKRRFSF